MYIIELANKLKKRMRTGYLYTLSDAAILIVLYLAYDNFWWAALTYYAIAAITKIVDGRLQYLKVKKYSDEAKEELAKGKAGFLVDSSIAPWVIRDLYNLKGRYFGSK